jgi:hypothetical protein
MLQGPSSPGLPQDAVDFQNLLNQLRGKTVDLGRRGAEKLATPTGTRIAGLGAPVAFGLGSALQGDLLGGAGEIGGGLVGAGLVGGIAKGLETAGGAKGKILGAGVRLAGGLLGGGIGGAAAGGIGNMISGAGQALQGALGDAERRQLAQGQSPGVVPGTTGANIGFSADDIAKIEQLSRVTGRSQVDIAREMLPIQMESRNADLQRQMQLNQQTGQLTGALNRQTIMGNLAGGAQAQAGDTVRTMLTAANPYAASAFQYRG